MRETEINQEARPVHSDVSLMTRSYYSSTIKAFLKSTPEEVLAALVCNNDFSLQNTQRDAWLLEIDILRQVLSNYNGAVYFEYSIPRMGRRIDAVLLIGAVIFVLEFKVGEREFASSAIDQVFDYALDLKNFHATSHRQYIAPILIATKAKDIEAIVAITHQSDKLFFPIKTNVNKLHVVIDEVLSFADGNNIDRLDWERGSYCPTPTIIEAAMALYNNHSVSDISRSDASAINLSVTSEVISKIICSAREKKQKSICFVTGVPGAGKTLVGLNIATTHVEKSDDLYSVFLSGNGPLVAILREALARDKVRRNKECGIKVKMGEARSEVKAFIQNVHHFRDDCLSDSNPPKEHVALFDEAQRAWDADQTASFMRRKKNTPNFVHSEPEFLISCLDRHPDWAVIVCLVGGGQEINTGEAGIGEWIASLNRSFPDWKIFISSRLTDSEYSADEILRQLTLRSHVEYFPELHLSVSLRSFRSEHISLLVKQVLDLDVEGARCTLSQVDKKYPIVIARDVGKAKKWLKDQARGSERYGMVVSSQAERLKPYAIDVKSPIDPIHWFLDDKNDVRSSYYLEDVATEFHVQGLELDWVCVTWDADFRYSSAGWEQWSFCGNRWTHIRKKERKQYLKNAYRVLLTRARQGMVIVVPSGDDEDPTRDPKFYDHTFNYLKAIGFSTI